jgi:hypothetical protein
MSATPDEAPTAAQSLFPLLKTFTAGDIAIVGCHAARISRESCEYDLLVIGKESLPYRTLRIGETYVDVLFKEPWELERADPQFLAGLSRLVPLRDNSLVLAGTLASAKRNFQTNCRNAADAKLASALKSLGRVQEASENAAYVDADLWLLSAGYDFSFGALLSQGVVPATSHIFDQMKALPAEHSHFREWSDAIGLSLSSRATCDNRLEGLSILYDLMRTVELDQRTLDILSRYRSPESMEVVRTKAMFQLESMQSVSCFAYLGLEVVQALTNLMDYRCHALSVEPDHLRIVEFLTDGKDRIIAQDVIRILELVRTKEMIQVAASSLRDCVTDMAKLL